MKLLGQLFYAVFILTLGSIFSGFVLTKLWEWFVIPTFQLPSLSIPVAIGLAIIVTYLTHQDLTEFKKKNNELSTAGKFAVVTGKILVKPTISLIVGYIVLQFV